jgi:hypothetical protein
MSVLAIIVLVVVVVAIAFALFVFVPRARAKAREKKRERELGQRRERAVSERREEADRRTRRAEEAELRARIAEQEAARERADAQLRRDQAALHERGMADHELMDERDRERFAGTSATPDGDDRSERDRSRAYQEGQRSVGEPVRADEFARGRRQEESRR